MLLTFLVIFIGPYVWSVSGSFKRTNAEVLVYPFKLMPKRFYLRNYFIVFGEANFGHYLLNSFSVTMITTVLALQNDARTSCPL